jgi:hypothetical protein
MAGLTTGTGIGETGAGLRAGIATGPRIGAVLWILGALIALAVAAQGYLTPYSGIDGTGGALLVILSSALLLAAGLVVGLALGPAAAGDWPDRFVSRGNVGASR